MLLHPLSQANACTYLNVLAVVGMTRGTIFGRMGKNGAGFRPLIGLAVAAMMAPPSLLAQTLSDSDLQKRANGILTLMGFALTPDVTTGSLSLTDQTAGNPSFRQTSLSGGGTLKSVPLYEVWRK